MCRAFKAIVRTFAFNLSEVGNWGVLSRGKIRFALHFKRIILDVLLRIDCRGQSARSGVRRSLQVMYAFLMEPRGLGNRTKPSGNLWAAIRSCLSPDRSGEGVLPPEGPSHLDPSGFPASLPQAAGQRLPGRQAHHLGQLHHQQGRGGACGCRGSTAAPSRLSPRALPLAPRSTPSRCAPPGS